MRPAAHAVRSAFSLIELAAAIGVIAVGLTAVIGTYLAGIGVARDAKHAYTAVETARGVADESTFTSGMRNGYWIERSTATVTMPANPETGLPAVELERIEVTLRESADPAAVELLTMHFHRHDE